MIVALGTNSAPVRSCHCCAFVVCCLALVGVNQEERRAEKARYALEAKGAQSGRNVYGHMDPVVVDGHYHQGPAQLAFENIFAASRGPARLDALRDEATTAAAAAALAVVGDDCAHDRQVAAAVAAAEVYRQDALAQVSFAYNAAQSVLYSQLHRVQSTLRRHTVGAHARECSLVGCRLLILIHDC